MIVRLSRWACTAEGSDGATAAWHERLLPSTYADVPGLLEAAFFAQPDGTRIAFTRWSSDGAYERAVASGLFKGISDEFTPFFVDGERPRAEAFDVVARRVYEEASDD